MSVITVVAVGDTAGGVIDELMKQHHELRIVRRCPELVELLAACQSGLAQVAVVAAFSSELSATLVDRLTAVGVSIVAVALSSEEAQRLRSIGATVVTEQVTAQELLTVVHSALEGRKHPGYSGFSVPAQVTALAPQQDLGSQLPFPTAPPGAVLDAEPASGAVHHAGEVPSGSPENAAAETRKVEKKSSAAKRLRPGHGGAEPRGGATRGGAIVEQVRDATEVKQRKLRRRKATIVQGPPEQGSGPGTLVAVWGPIGSPGRTTISINLAAEQAASGRQVMLIDADSYGASVAAALGLLDEAASFAHACRAADQGSLTLADLAKTATQVVFHGGTFSLLTGLTRADRWPELRAAAVARVLRLACELWDLVIVDCGFSLENDEELSYDTVAPRRNAATLTVLGQADLVYAVGNSDPIGIPRLIRGLSELAQNYPAVEVRVVANKVRRKAVGGNPEKSLAQAWERFGPAQSIKHFLPWDPELTDKALLEGRLLQEIAAEAPLRLAIADMDCAADQRMLKIAVAKATARVEYQG
ncbi:AAA family ATPase [Arthrobacter antibioticus]|uniref:AAA family ATPase n=1 Tax=Arthrobacter sp. H35-MC1 TaxID=3046203 RepID=UPI0024BADD5B|nr:chromosome partitioning protein [Arthrobacter sp. H35-MC1]MDJ0316495.1 chromosome partitioning protein [Arthrobacter sp. H35-MC1]